jgi:hypothetical protein
LIKFPPKPSADRPLVLPRRRLRSPFDVSETAAEAQKTISAIRSATRNPWGDPNSIDQSKLGELEKSLKALATKLEERERSIQDLEIRLSERERDLAETATLLKAREALMEAGKNKHGGAVETRSLSHEEQAALEKLKAEVERQQASLLEQKQALREREDFLDESETKLFEKVQEQQEKETELEQREEEVRGRERRLREREALNDPKLAASLKAEKEAAKRHDEFRE